METMRFIEEIVNTNSIKLESTINIGNKRYLVKRHFLGKRELTEAINKVIINDAVRKTV